MTGLISVRDLTQTRDRKVPGLFTEQQQAGDFSALYLKLNALRGEEVLI